MPTIKLKNFKYGLDTRKSNVESIAGTLTELENAHINQGGEIEKRKAFVYTAFPANTFGAQATAAGIVTFGSVVDPEVATPGTWAAISTAVGETVYYQRLQHPADIFENTSTRVMDAILFSETFGLYAFAVAHFTDGQSFAYYNGTPIYDFIDGLILSHLSTNAKIAEELENIIDRGGVFDGAQLGGADNYKVNMTGPLGTSYNVTVSEVTAGTGLLSVTKTSEPTAGTVALQAIGSFQIIAGSATLNAAIATTNRARTSNVATLTIGTHTYIVGSRINVASVGGAGYNASDLVITAVSATTISYANTGGDEGTTADVTGLVTFQNQVIKVEVGPSAGPLVTITNAAINWTNSNEFTASLIAANINTVTSNPEYTAEASGNLVTIKAALADGDSPNNYVVQTTAAGNVCIGKVQFQIQLGNGTFNITSLMINGIDQMFSPANVDVDVAVLNVATAASDIAGIINANTSIGLGRGYIANATGAIVSLSKAVTRSDDPPQPTYFVHNAGTTGGGVYEVGGGGGGSVASMTVSLVATGYNRRYASGSFVYVSWNLSLIISGGVLPYQSPVWSMGGVTTVGGGAYKTAEVLQSVYVALVPPHIYCTVTDSSAQIVQSNTL